MKYGASFEVYVHFEADDPKDVERLALEIIKEALLDEPERINIWEEPCPRRPHSS